MSSFTVIPAVDLRDGRVVRLRAGDFCRMTTYGADPVSAARMFVQAGARWLHVVDLDGARTGTPQNAAVITAIIETLGAEGPNGVAVEVAGGIRTLETARRVLDAGAARVVLGTAALADPDLVARMLESLGATRLAVAIDVRDGLAVGSAWQAGAPGVSAVEAVSALARLGVATFEVTAIERDGSLEGPDLDLLATIRTTLRHEEDSARGGPQQYELVASGGIRSVEDLRAVRDLGCSGAIVGRSILEGRLDLSEAISALG
jgi:phosphoribosylformimino-5-aminoimidazole carboxamide ribotide isomerase